MYLDKNARLCFRVPSGLSMVSVVNPLLSPKRQKYTGWAFPWQRQEGRPKIGRKGGKLLSMAYVPPGAMA